MNKLSLTLQFGDDTASTLMLESNASLPCAFLFRKATRLFADRGKTITGLRSASGQDVDLGDDIGSVFSSGDVVVATVEGGSGGGDAAAAAPLPDPSFRAGTYYAVSQMVRVRDEASGKGGIIGDLDDGLVCKALASEGDWLRIDWPKTSSAWVMHTNPVTHRVLLAPSDDQTAAATAWTEQREKRHPTPQTSPTRALSSSSKQATSFNDAGGFQEIGNALGGGGAPKTDEELEMLAILKGISGSATIQRDGDDEPPTAARPPLAPKQPKPKPQVGKSAGPPAGPTGGAFSPIGTLGGGGAKTDEELEMLAILKGISGSTGGRNTDEAPPAAPEKKKVKESSKKKTVPSKPPPAAKAAAAAGSPKKRPTVKGGDILGSLEESAFYETLAMTKGWKDQAASLAELEGLLNAPEINDGDYGRLVSTLTTTTSAKMFQLSSLSVKLLGVLATRLGDRFQPFAVPVATQLLSRTVEKKMVRPIRTALDAIHASGALPLPSIASALVVTINPPKKKLQHAQVMAAEFASSATMRDSVAPLAPADCEALLGKLRDCLLANSDNLVRDALVEAMASILAVARALGSAGKSEKQVAKIESDILGAGDRSSKKSMIARITDRADVILATLKPAAAAAAAAAPPSPAAVAGGGADAAASPGAPEAVAEKTTMFSRMFGGSKPASESAAPGAGSAAPPAPAAAAPDAAPGVVDIAARAAEEDFYAKAQAAKWSEKSAAVQWLVTEMHAADGTTPAAIASSPEGVRSLVEALHPLAGDKMMQVAAVATKALGVLSAGLGTAFAPHGHSTTHLLLVRTKEKRLCPHVTTALDCMFAAGGVTLPEVWPTVIGTINPTGKTKVPHSQLAGISFLGTCLNRAETAGKVSKKLRAAMATALCEAIHANADNKLRDGLVDALGSLVRVVCAGDLADRTAALKTVDASLEEKHKNICRRIHDLAGEVDEALAATAGGGGGGAPGDGGGGETGAEDEAAQDGGDDDEEKDLFRLVPKDCAERLGGSKWQGRKAAMEEIIAACEESDHTIKPTKAALAVLKDLVPRLADSQSNLKPVAAHCIGHLVQALGPDASPRCGKICARELVSCIGDNKKQMRDAVLAGLEMAVTFDGAVEPAAVASFVAIVGAVAKSTTTGRLELIEWLKRHVPDIPPNYDDGLLEPVLVAIQDRAGAVRTEATALLAMLIGRGSNKKKKLDKLIQQAGTPAAQKSLHAAVDPMFETARTAQRASKPAEAASRSRSSSWAEAGAPFADDGPLPPPPPPVPPRDEAPRPGPSPPPLPELDVEEVLAALDTFSHMRPPVDKTNAAYVECKAKVKLVHSFASRAAETADPAGAHAEVFEASGELLSALTACLATSFTSAKATNYDTAVAGSGAGGIDTQLLSVCLAALMAMFRLKPFCGRVGETHLSDLLSTSCSRLLDDRLGYTEGPYTTMAPQIVRALNKLSISSALQVERTTALCAVAGLLSGEQSAPSANAKRTGIYIKLMHRIVAEEAENSTVGKPFGSVDVPRLCFALDVFFTDHPPTDTLVAAQYRVGEALVRGMVASLGEKAVRGALRGLAAGSPLRGVIG